MTKWSSIVAFTNCCYYHQYQHHYYLGLGCLLLLIKDYKKNCVIDFWPMDFAHEWLNAKNLSTVFYINIIHFTYLFFLINTYTPCHSLLAKIAFQMLCMGYKLGTKPSWNLVWNIHTHTHLIFLMNAYLLETSLQIQKLNAC